MATNSLRERLSANIAFMFPEMDFLDRIDAAAASGFKFVECHFPYDIPKEALVDRLTAANITMSGLNTAPGDIAAGEWGTAALPGRQKDFEKDFEQALSYAVAVGARVIHVMAGIVDATARDVKATYVTNLQTAAAKAAPHGITLILEPLNSRDKPGYLVSRSDDLVTLIAEVDRPNVKLLFDVYHVQIMEGDITKRLERHAPFIGHVQLASVPDRVEPDEGELKLGQVLRALDRIRYDGLIGLEHKPRGDTRAGLSWIDRVAASI